MGRLGTVPTDSENRQADRGGHNHREGLQESDAKGHEERKSSSAESCLLGEDKNRGPLRMLGFERLVGFGSSELGLENHSADEPVGPGLEPESAPGSQSDFMTKRNPHLRRDAGHAFQGVSPQLDARHEAALLL